MNSIEQFRARRNERIKNRKDADDIQWISTEEGSHIPLKNGKSVGGWSKGKDFSSAKTEKAESKGMSSPTQKLSRDLKKCKSKNEYQYALNRAEKGSKVYIQNGDLVEGYEKTGEGMYGLWKRTYGTGSIGEFVEGHKLGIRAEASDYCGTTMKEARNRFSNVFPRISKEYGTRKSAEGQSRDSSSAEYYKGLSGKKELYGQIEKKPYKLNFKFEKFLSENGIDSDDYEYNPKTKTMTVKVTESHGRGKPKTESERKFRVQLSGGKYTKVNNKGKVIPYREGEDSEYVINPKFIEI